MGRIGFGVEFVGADSTVPPTHAVVTPYAQMMNGLGDLVDDVSVSAVRIAMDQARQLRTIEQTRVWAVKAAMSLPGGDSRHAREELAERSFAAQMASALHLPEGTARNLIWTAQCLVNELPMTLEFLSDGAISLRHAQILVDQVGALDATSMSVLEQKVLQRGMQQTPPQFERSVRTMSEKLKLESIVDRQVAAEEQRTVYREPMRNGMGRLVLEGPIVQIVAIDNRATDIARSLQVEGEVRTLAQLKFDVLADLALDVDAQQGTTAGNGDGPVARYRSIRAQVLVTVPVLTLLKGGVDPGTLEGYGPIDPQTAREIASNARSMIRILTHPETGIVLSMGRRRYRIPKELRLWLRLRDGTCRFPGCNRAATNCEVDHTREWATENGETAHNNLAHLCPGHHTLKGNTDWKVTQDDSGSGNLTWTSPTGHIFRTEPEIRVAA